MFKLNYDVCTFIYNFQCRHQVFIDDHVPRRSSNGYNIDVLDDFCLGDQKKKKKKRTGYVPMY